MLFRSVWPFPEKEVVEVLKSAKTVVVPELNLGQLYEQIAIRNSFGTKLIPINKVKGELITPQEIIDALKEEC